jgi:hypothetical protein
LAKAGGWLVEGRRRYGRQCATGRSAVDTAFTPATKTERVRKMFVGKVSGPDYLDVDAALPLRSRKTDAVAYDAFLETQFRVHRNGQMPITTKDGLHSFFAKEGKGYSYKTIGGKIASSKDLAFTYGSFQLNGSSEVAVTTFTFGAKMIVRVAVGRRYRERVAEKVNDEKAVRTNEVYSNSLVHFDSGLWSDLRPAIEAGNRVDLA